jgi:hypothetical protein
LLLGIAVSRPSKTPVTGGIWLAACLGSTPGIFQI